MAGETRVAHDAAAEAPLGRRRYWKIAPGEGAKYREQWLEGGFASIGWASIGDLSGVGREEFAKRRAAALAKHPTWKASGLDQVWHFANFEIGDRVVANRGTTHVLALGTVAGEYYFVSGADHPHRVRVDWDDVGETPVEQLGWRRTLVKLNADDFEKIVAMRSTQAGAKPQVPVPEPGLQLAQVNPAEPLEAIAEENLAAP